MGFYKSVDVNKEYSYDEIWDMYITNADYKRGDVVGIVDLFILIISICFFHKVVCYTQALQFVSKESLRFKIFIKISHPL